jgi:hypothetical protein
VHIGPQEDYWIHPISRKHSSPGEAHGSTEFLRSSCLRHLMTSVIFSFWLLEFFSQIDIRKLISYLTRRKGARVVGALGCARANWPAPRWIGGCHPHWRPCITVGRQWAWHPTLNTGSAVQALSSSSFYSSLNWSSLSLSLSLPRKSPLEISSSVPPSQSSL